MLLAYVLSYFRHSSRYSNKHIAFTSFQVNIFYGWVNQLTTLQLPEPLIRDPSATSSTLLLSAPSRLDSDLHIIHQSRYKHILPVATYDQARISQGAVIFLFVPSW